jgi:histidinol dehydrogenase
MSDKLDKILISYKQADFQDKLYKFRLSKLGLSHFGIGALHVENRRKVEEILNEVVINKDNAVAKYTEEFDGVKLTPDQFRISHADLKRAHKEIDTDLMASIRQTIKNVRR